MSPDPVRRVTFIRGPLEWYDSRRQLLCDRKDPFAHLTPRRLALTVIKSTIVTGAPLLNEAILESLDEDVRLMAVSRCHMDPFIPHTFMHALCRHCLPFPVIDFVDLRRHCRLTIRSGMQDSPSGSSNESRARQGGDGLPGFMLNDSISRVFVDGRGNIVRTGQQELDEEGRNEDTDLMKTLAKSFKNFPVLVS